MAQSVDKTVTVKQEVFGDKNFTDFLEQTFEGVKADCSGGKLILQGKEKIVERTVKSLHQVHVDVYRKQFIVSDVAVLQYLNEELKKGSENCYLVRDKHNVYVCIPHIKKKECLRTVTSLIEDHILLYKYDGNYKYTRSFIDEFLFAHTGKVLSLEESVLAFTKDLEDNVKKQYREAKRNVNIGKMTQVTYNIHIDERCKTFIETYCPDVRVHCTESSFSLFGTKSELLKGGITIVDLDIDCRKEQLIFTEDQTRLFVNEKLQRKNIVCYLVLGDQKVCGLQPSGYQNDNKVVSDIIDKSICVIDIEEVDEDDVNKLLFEVPGKITNLNQENNMYLVFTKDILEKVTSVLKKGKKTRIALQKLVDDHFGTEVQSRTKSNEVSGKVRRQHAEASTCGDENVKHGNENVKHGSHVKLNTEDAGFSSDEAIDAYCEEKYRQIGRYGWKTEKEGWIDDNECDNYYLMDTNEKSDNEESNSEDKIHLEMEAELASYLFCLKKAEIYALERRYGCSTTNQNGSITVTGGKQRRIINIVTEIAKSVCMYSSYLDEEKMRESHTESFGKIWGKLEGEETQVTIYPCSTPRVKEAVHVKGVEVQLVHGSAADVLQTDALFCPLDNEMHAVCASAGHITAKGGEELRQRLLDIASDKGSQPNYSVQFFSKTGYLPVKHVCTMVLEDIYHGHMQDFEDRIKSKLKHIYEWIIQRRCTSLTVPLEVGQKIPVPLMARAWCNALREFLTENKGSILKTVTLCVVNEGCLSSLSLTTLFQLEPNPTRQISESRSPEPLPRKTTCIQPDTYDMAHTNVILKTGSLTDQRVDALVVPVNTMLDLVQGAISGVVLKAAGPEVQKQLKKQNPSGLGPMDVIHTGPGKLNISHILYSNLPELKKGTTDYGPPEMCIGVLMENIFKVAKELKIKSLALPAFGTGAMRYPSDIVAMEMIRSIFLHAEQAGVTTVIIVVYKLDSELYKWFEKAVRQYEEVVTSAHKAAVQSPSFVELHNVRWKPFCQIVDNSTEVPMSDVLIKHRKPTYTEKMDEYPINGVIVRKVSNATNLVRGQIFLDLSYVGHDFMRADKIYKKSLEFAIRYLRSQLLTIDLSFCQSAKETRLIIEKISKILDLVLKRENRLHKLNFIVGEEGLQLCIKYVEEKQEQHSRKKTGVFSITGLLRGSSDTEWRIRESRVLNAKGAYLVICSTSQQRLQRAVIAVKEELTRKVTTVNEATYFDDVTAKSEDTYKNDSQDRSPQMSDRVFVRKISSGSTGELHLDSTETNFGDVTEKTGDSTNKDHPHSKSSPRSDRNYQHKLTKKSTEDLPMVPVNLTADLPTTIIRHLSKQSLDRFLNALNKDFFAEIVNESVKVSVPYNSQAKLATILDGELKDLDKTLFYVRNIDPQSAHLVQLYCLKTGRISTDSWQYNWTDQEIEVKHSEKDYEELKKKAELFRYYQTDTVDVSKAEVSVPETLEGFMVALDPKFINILVEAYHDDKAINIYYPVEEQDKALHVINMIQVQLKILKKTGRRQRRFDDTTSLKATVTHEKEESEVKVNKPSKSEMVSETRHSDKQSITRVTSQSSYSVWLSRSQQNSSDVYYQTIEEDKQSMNSVYFTEKNLIIKVYKGDIKNLDVECIVNAANEQLFHGAGIAAVIASAAGREFDRECRRYIKDNGPLDVGQCMSTGAGHLPYRYVLHAVGPQWGMYEDKEDCKYDLKMSIVNILRRAEVLKMKSVAIPPISTGIFGVPWGVCAEQYARGIVEFEEDSQGVVQEVHFIDINENILQEIRSAIALTFKEQTSDELAGGVSLSVEQASDEVRSSQARGLLDML